MKIKDLNEKFLNFWGKHREQKEKYAEEVMDLLEKAYAKLGGPHTTIEELLEPNMFWKLVRKNNKIIAASIYKDQGAHRKMVCGGAITGPDGKATPEGKKAFYEILSDDINFFDRGAYGEVSEAIEHITIDNLGAKVIPAEKAVEILRKAGKKVDHIDSDGIHYFRKIGSGDDQKLYRKAMIGNIPEI